MNSIETKDLTKKYKDKVAVNGINLQIKEGELFALLGVNGAGKNPIEFNKEVEKFLVKKLK